MLTDRLYFLLLLAVQISTKPDDLDCILNVTTISVPSSAKIGDKIATLRAQCQDGELSDLQYELFDKSSEEGASDWFGIDISTGELYLHKSDLDVSGKIFVRTVVKDKKQDHTLTYLVVEYVDDVPRFTSSNWTIHVLETATELTDNVIDATVSANGNITYSIVNTEDGTFSIGKQDGVIALNSPLDREEEEEYILEVIAVNEAVEPPISAFTTVTIIVDDVNDNAPVCKPVEPIEVTVDTKGVLAKLDCSDADAGDNALLSYSILSASDLNSPLVSIDDQGRISASLRLRHLVGDASVTTIHVTDGGSPPLSRILAVHLHATTTISDKIRKTNEILASLEEKKTKSSVKTAVGALEELTNDLFAQGLKYTEEELDSATQSFLSLVSGLIDRDNTEIWTDLVEEDVSPVQVSHMVDQFQKGLLQTIDFNGTKTFAANNIFTTIHSTEIGWSNEGLELPIFADKDQPGDSVHLPHEILYFSNASSTKIAVTQYRAAILNSSLGALPMASDALSVVIHPTLAVSLTEPVSLTIRKQAFSDGRKTLHCSFLDLANSNWSQDGCRVHSVNSTHVTCQCYHLTNFAVLMQVVDIELSQTVIWSLETLTVIGSSISLVAMGISVIVIIWLRYFTDRLLIMLNLMIALGLAQTIFLTGVNAIYNFAVCRLVAVLLHYFYLCVFGLMLVEGVQLYQKLYRSFSDGIHVGWLLGLAWGIPMIVVGITLGIRVDDYGTAERCWLSLEHGTIWAFVGPALFVISVNTVVLGLVLRVYVTVRINAKKSEIAKIRSSVKAAIVLLPLVGITWLFGVLAMNSSTVVFQYFFAVLNSLQGFFIFLFHVALNDDIQLSLKKKRDRITKSRTWQTLSSTNSSKIFTVKQNAVHPVDETTTTSGRVSLHC